MRFRPINFERTFIGDREFGASDFYECCTLNLTDLYQFAERGRIGKGKFIKLIDWLYFRR